MYMYKCFQIYLEKKKNTHIQTYINKLFQKKLKKQSQTKMGILERIADIENEINRTQKNKGIISIFAIISCYYYQ